MTVAGQGKSASTSWEMSAPVSSRKMTGGEGAVRFGGLWLWNFPQVFRSTKLCPQHPESLQTVRLSIEAGSKASRRNIYSKVDELV